MTRRSAALWISLGLLAGCKAEAPKAPPAEPPARSELTSAPAPAETAAPEETVKGSQTLSGTFVGFETGDYLHGVFAVPGGEKRSFFLERGMEIFLVDHASEPLELEVQTVETDIPEAGGRMDIERLHSIRAGTASFAAWWKTAEPSFGKLLDEHQARIDKATLAPEDAPTEGS